MAIVSKPFTFTAGATIIASEHNSDFDTLYNDYNGNITNLNIAAGAAIADTKLGALTTANKVNGSSFYQLSNVPLLAGVFPIDNLFANGILPVLTATNLTSLNASNLTTGTVATARLGSGTASSTTVLLGDSSWGNVSNIKFYTANGTFTALSGITKVYCTMAGGGGGGGGGAFSSGFGAGGAGGAAVVNYPITVTPGSTYTVAPGTAGVGSAGGTNGSPPSVGGTGGTSSFSNLSVLGGIGGGGGRTSSTCTGGTVQVSNANANSNTAGTFYTFGAGFGGGGTDSVAGAGGGSLFGNGGAASGGTGTGYGAGGGGGETGNPVGATGGSGTAGVIILIF